MVFHEPEIFSADLFELKRTSNTPEGGIGGSSYCSPVSSSARYNEIELFLASHKEMELNPSVLYSSVDEFFFRKNGTGNKLSQHDSLLLTQ